MIPQHQIAELLRTYLPPNVAQERANWVFEDMTAMGFPLELSHENPPGFWLAHNLVPQAEYVLPKSSFSIDSEDDNLALSGSFLTVGNLLRLSGVLRRG